MCFPGAAQRVVMRCRPGIVTNSECRVCEDPGSSLHRYALHRVRGRWRQPARMCLSGSSQNAHTAEPMTNRHAATMNGACQLPTCASTPNTIGDNAPPILPAMFIMPDTVPEYLPPVSIGTAHDGPIVHSRKNIEAVRHHTAV